MKIRRMVRSQGFEPGIISLEGFHTAKGYRRFNVLNQLDDDRARLSPYSQRNLRLSGLEVDAKTL